MLDFIMHQKRERAQEEGSVITEEQKINFMRPFDTLCAFSEAYSLLPDILYYA